MNKNRFVQERDRAFTDFVQTGDLKAVRECRGIQQEVKDLAAVKCVELGFSPTMR